MNHLVEFFKEKIKKEMIDYPGELANHFLEFYDHFDTPVSVQWSINLGIIVSPYFNTSDSCITEINIDEHPEEFKEVMTFLVDIVEAYSL